MQSEDIEIRNISKNTTLAMEEIQQCITIQEKVKWQSEIVPSHVFRADSIGRIDDSINLGYVLLALKNKYEIIGFARVTSTFNIQKHWLHEVAVIPDSQSKHVGMKLMEGIKRKSIELGGSSLYFTYDPFEGQNGRLYLTKCGAKAIKVYEDFYGFTNTGAHGNRKTHRFLVKWDLNKKISIQERIGNRRISTVSSLPVPHERKLIKVEIPYCVQELSEKEAKRWQDSIFPILVKAINIYDYRAISIQTDKDVKRNFIVLEKETVPQPNAPADLQGSAALRHANP